MHALLAYLEPRLPHIPKVLGFDEQGREILSYLPGRVIDTATERLNERQIVAVVGWTRAFHAAVREFSHPGPWRYFPLPSPTIIGHNDIAPYNVCFTGDELAGVFDWDLAGPSTPLFELAFIAWNCVPLWTDTGSSAAASRLALIASTYGAVDPLDVLYAVPPRIQAMLDGIPVAAAAGDKGMANLVAQGEPERSRQSLGGLVERIPEIARELS